VPVYGFGKIEGSAAEKIAFENWVLYFGNRNAFRDRFKINLMSKPVIF
jgi:hypothetical protein